MKCKLVVCPHKFVKRKIIISVAGSIGCRFYTRFSTSASSSRLTPGTMESTDAAINGFDPERSANKMFDCVLTIFSSPTRVAFYDALR